MTAGALEEIGDAALAHPALEVVAIERASLDAEHAEDVVPLPLGDAVAEAEPLELVQDDVLGGGQREDPVLVAERVTRSKAARSKERCLRMKMSSFIIVARWITLNDERRRTASRIMSPSA